MQVLRGWFLYAWQGLPTRAPQISGEPGHLGDASCKTTAPYHCPSNSSERATNRIHCRTL